MAKVFLKDRENAITTKFMQMYIFGEHGTKKK